MSQETSAVARCGLIHFPELRSVLSILSNSHMHSRSPKSPERNGGKCPAVSPKLRFRRDYWAETGAITTAAQPY